MSNYFSSESKLFQDLGLDRIASGVVKGPTRHDATIVHLGIPSLPECIKSGKVNENGLFVGPVIAAYLSELVFRNGSDLPGNIVVFHETPLLTGSEILPWRTDRGRELGVVVHRPYVPTFEIGIFALRPLITTVDGLENKVPALYIPNRGLPAGIYGSGITMYTNQSLSLVPIERGGIVTYIPASTVNSAIAAMQ